MRWLSPEKGKGVGGLLLLCAFVAGGCSDSDYGQNGQNWGEGRKGNNNIVFLFSSKLIQFRYLLKVLNGISHSPFLLLTTNLHLLDYSCSKKGVIANKFHIIAVLAKIGTLKFV